MLNESFEELICFQRALKDLISAADPLYSKQHEEFFIGFEGRLVVGGIHKMVISILKLSQNNSSEKTEIEKEP